MTHIILYFSGTGNSLVVAKELADGLEGSEILPISGLVQGKILPERLARADTIGIVFPVYMWGMPLIVADSLKLSPADTQAYIYSVTTCGGSAGATLLRLNAGLKSRGLKLSAGWVVVMPGNFTPMYGAISDADQQKLFAKVTKRLPDIIYAVKERLHRPIEHSFFLVNAILSGIVYRLGSVRIPVMDKKYWVTDSCNHCELCSQVCPVGNIRMEDSRPQWNHQCQMCMACIQWCPQQAIQYGKNTMTRKRYHHPAISLNELIQHQSTLNS